MGEISEMMLDGTLDMYTGEYIGEATGYPRTLLRDTESQFRGIMRFMGKKGITSKKERRIFLEKFFGDGSTQMSNRELAVFASERFNKFRAFLLNQIGKNKS